jgi:thiamine biosynthesis lipoprotein
VLKWICSSVFAAALIAAPPQAYEAVEPHMGTLFRMKLYAADAEQAKAAFHAAFARVAELDDLLSDYNPASELNRLSRTAVGRPLPASRDLVDVLTAAQRLAEESGGAFDVTLGPVIRLWREARRTHRAPEPGALAIAASHTGFQKLHVDRAAGTVLLDQAGMQLDVGGIAKGYAADAALAALRDLGIGSARVAARGDLAIGDAPPGQPGWKVGIDSLDSANAPFAQILCLHNAAVSTSGASEQHADIGGKRYSHIINPATRAGLTQDVTVTVIAPSGAEADGSATALSILGVERGLRFADDHPGMSALFIVRNVDGIQRRYSSYFPIR